MAAFRTKTRKHIVPVMMFLMGIIVGQVILSHQYLVVHLIPQSVLKDLWDEGQGPKLVLITTYMRSGSSLTGDILKHMPGAFYVFEPLFHLEFPKNFAYLNGTKIDWNDTQPGEDEYERQLVAWFRCDLERVAPFDLFMTFGDQTNEFQLCKNANGTDSTTRCLPDLIEACKRSKVIVVKTIRLKLGVAFRVAESVSNLHVLHLVRDPRGVLTSRGRLDPTTFPNMTVATAELCSSMMEDLEVAQTRGAALGPRYKLVRYEDIAMDPLAATEDLYGFVGEKVPASSYGYVYCITQCGKATEETHNTERANSQATASAWRVSAKPELLEAVLQSKNCTRMIQQARYRLFEDPGSLANMSISFSL